MTVEDYDKVKAECFKRGYKNVDQVIALSNVMELIRTRVKYYLSSSMKEHELTYCGKTHRQWAKVKRQNQYNSERKN